MLNEPDEPPKSITADDTHERVVRRGIREFCLQVLSISSVAILPNCIMRLGAFYEIMSPGCAELALQRGYHRFMRSCFLGLRDALFLFGRTYKSWTCYLFTGCSIGCLSFVVRQVDITVDWHLHKVDSEQKKLRVSNPDGCDFMKRLVHIQPKKSGMYRWFFISAVLRIPPFERYLPCVLTGRFDKYSV